MQNKMVDLVRVLMWKSYREESFTEASVLLGFDKPRESAEAAERADATVQSTEPPAAIISEADKEVAVADAASAFFAMPKTPPKASGGADVMHLV